MGFERRSDGSHAVEVKTERDAVEAVFSTP
jgi:hypothetical protein